LPPHSFSAHFVIKKKQRIDSTWIRPVIEWGDSMKSHSIYEQLYGFSAGCAVVLSVVLLLLPTVARADEQLFGFVLGSETLPKGRSEAYQFITFRTGKAEGTYQAFDFETEVEHGFTDKFQGSLSVEQHHFYNKGVNSDRDAFYNTNAYRFGGVGMTGKYNFLSPFKDPFGFSFLLDAEYKLHDEVDGLKEHETIIYPNFIFQKNFFDDTLIVDLNAGVELDWGKRPAEQYAYELAATGALGVSYRIAPDWYLGLESQIRSEYPRFDLGDHEHTVIYGGPAIHYATKRWWVTFSYAYQIFGTGIDEPADGYTFAEEQKHQVRLKFGVNF
jgi:hypothetical protein